MLTICFRSAESLYTNANVAFLLSHVWLTLNAFTPPRPATAPPCSIALLGLPQATRLAASARSLCPTYSSSVTDIDPAETHPAIHRKPVARRQLSRCRHLSFALVLPRTRACTRVRRPRARAQAQVPACRTVLNAGSTRAVTSRLNWLLHPPARAICDPAVRNSGVHCSHQ